MPFKNNCSLKIQLTNLPVVSPNGASRVFWRAFLLAPPPKHLREPPFMGMRAEYKQKIMEKKMKRVKGTVETKICKITGKRVEMIYTGNKSESGKNGHKGWLCLHKGAGINERSDGTV